MRMLLIMSETLTVVRPSTFILVDSPFGGPLSLARWKVHPWCVRGGFPPSVRELYADRSSMSMSEVHDAFQRLDLGVGPEPLNYHT